MSNEIVTAPTTVRHHVGTCPGCKVGIYAEVEMVTEVHPPRLDRDGKPLDCAHAVITASRVDHFCARVDGDWTWPNGDAGD